MRIRPGGSSDGRGDLTGLDGGRNDELGNVVGVSEHHEVRTVDLDDLA